MQITSSSSCKNSKNENVVPFEKSLQELRELRSQLHYAADYCESTFLNAKERKMVVDTTKEYICRAVVAVVDHLGCVSSNLNCSISDTNGFSEAELQINTLKQRLLSCEQYAHKLALTRVRWHPVLPKFHRQYLSTPVTGVEKSNNDEKMECNSLASENIIDKHGIRAEDKPNFLYTCTQSAQTIGKNDSDSASVLPVRDCVSILSKGPNPTFHFQQISQKHGRYNLFRRVHSNDILSLIQKIKRTG